MSECCGPSSGIPERVSPELMEKFREIGRREAARRGITYEEYLDANVTVNRATRLATWMRGVWINLQLLKPWL